MKEKKRLDWIDKCKQILKRDGYCGNIWSCLDCPINYCNCYNIYKKAQAKLAELEALGQERKFGKFWDDDEDLFIYGYLTDICDKISTKYCVSNHAWYKHFQPTKEPVFEPIEKKQVPYIRNQAKFEMWAWDVRHLHSFKAAATIDQWLGWSEDNEK